MLGGRPTKVNTMSTLHDDHFPRRVGDRFLAELANGSRFTVDDPNEFYIMSISGRWVQIGVRNGSSSEYVNIDQIVRMF